MNSRFGGHVAGCLCLAFVLAFLAPARAAVRGGSAQASAAQPASTPWTARHQYGSIVYFAYDTPPRIERFDGASRSWLAPIFLGGAVTAFDVDASGIYVSLASGVWRMDLSGTGVVMLPSVPGARRYLTVAGPYLFAGDGVENESYRKSDGAFISSYFTYLDVVESIETESRLVGFSSGSIETLTFDPGTGALQQLFVNPGLEDSATSVFPRAEGGLIVDDAGSVFASSDLHYVGSLGVPVQDIAYLPNDVVIASHGKLVRFSYDLRRLGETEAGSALAGIVAVNGTLFSINATQGALAASPVSLDAFDNPSPPPARPWSQTGGLASGILGNDAQALWFPIASEHAAYPFDTATWTFGDPVPMFYAPLSIAYSTTNQRLYASYEGGSIYAFPVAVRGTAEYFASTVIGARSLASAGEFVFAQDDSGAWASHYTFAPDGALRSRLDWNEYSRQYEWDPHRRRMYFFRDGTSPNDLMWEEIGVDGTIVDAGETPYHGEVYADTPIRVSADGGTIVLGSGQVFETGGLTLIGDLGHHVSDMAWSTSHDLYAIGSDGASRFLRFSPSYAVVSSGAVRGTPRRLLPYGSNFLYVADVAGSTIVGVLDPFVSKADLAVDPVALGAVFGGGSTLAFDVTLGNNGSVAANGAHVSADLSALEDVSWTCVPDAWTIGCDNEVHASAEVSLDLFLGDGAQARVHVSGRIAPDAIGKLALPFQIAAADPTSDPEPRNNVATVRIRLDNLFRGTFDAN